MSSFSSSSVSLSSSSELSLVSSLFSVLELGASGLDSDFFGLSSSSEDSASDEDDFGGDCFLGCDFCCSSPEGALELKITGDRLSLEE